MLLYSRRWHEIPRKRALLRPVSESVICIYLSACADCAHESCHLFCELVLRDQLTFIDDINIAFDLCKASSVSNFSNFWTDVYTDLHDAVIQRLRPILDYAANSERFA